MILELGSDDAALQQEVAAFAAERLAPAAAAIDEDGRFPRQLVSELARRGLLGVTIGREWGGGGHGYVTYAVALEALAHASAVLAVIASVNISLVAEPIAQFGTDAQKHAWLRRLASGEAIGAFALSEEHAGSDAANQQTVARLDDWGYVLNGRKVWVANGEAADVAIVFAATQPGNRGRGIGAFLVPLDTPGLVR
ncbi:MAG: acyl-CoA dehydrogenase family protein, partial [Vicinamibacterales bacterium]